MANRCWILCPWLALLLPIGASQGQAQIAPGPGVLGPFDTVMIPGDDPRGYEQRDYSKRFFAPSPTQEQLQELRERRQAQRRDPEQLRALQVQMQANLKQANPDLARFLRIDAATEQRLLELMAQQAMQHEDAFERINAARDGSDALPGQAQLDQLKGEHSEQIEQLLGAAGMERYHYYRRTGSARQRLTLFTSRLEPSDQLRPDQQQRLLELLLELELQFLRRGGFDRLQGRSLPSPYMTAQQRQLRSQRVNVDANERALRDKEQAAAVALERVPLFLTASQVRAYAQWEAENLNRRRSYVQQLRSAAGLPEMVEPSELEASAERAVPGKLRLRFDIRIAGAQPRMLYLAADAGNTLNFRLSDELSAEARPILYANGATFVLLRLFERDQVLELPVYEMGLHSASASLADSRQPPFPMTHEVTFDGSRHHRIEIRCDVTVLGPPEDPTMQTAAGGSGLLDGLASTSIAKSW